MPSAQTPDGAQIFYERCGTGPINLAMISGWGGVGGLWFSVARHLDPHQFTCWLIDLRGHGRSIAPPGARFGWDEFAQDILSVAAAEQAETFIPAGFSMGGKLVLYLTAQHPSLIPRLILVAPAGPGPAPLDAEARRELIRRAGDPLSLKVAVRDWFGPAVSEAIIDGCCRAISRAPKAILEITAEKLLAASLPAGFERTDAPTLVIIGQNDPHYGPAYQQQYVLPFLSAAQTALLPSGHFVPLEDPAPLAALLPPFLRPPVR